LFAAISKIIFPALALRHTVSATAEFRSSTVAFSIVASAITNSLVPRRLAGDTKKPDFSLMQTSSCETSLRSRESAGKNRQSKLLFANQRLMASARNCWRLAQRLPFSRAKFRSKKEARKKQGQEKKKDTGGAL
jgi:hypothetical protein